MPALGQTWSMKAFLVDGSQCQATGDEPFIGRVGAVPMRVIFEEEGDPSEEAEALFHSEMTGSSPTCRLLCMTEWLLERSEPRPSHPIGGTTGS